jgi:D-amino-acid dehydrogenase
VILAFGHGHLGVTLAPITAQLVASFIASKSRLVEFPQLLPDRF